MSDRKPRRPRHQLLALSPDRPAEELLHEAEKALAVMLGVIVVIWVVQIANWADSYHLTFDYGIVPRDAGRLPEILSAPLLHLSWTHIEANSGPLFIFGFLAAFRGVKRFAGVTLVTVLTSGMAVWLFQGAHQLVVGASGVIYGYFGYVVVKGVFDGRLVDVLVGVVMALSFAYLLVAVVPGTPGVSWIGHLGGLVGGIASGYLFRERKRPAPPAIPDLALPS
ncbi:MAG TPA: rhomboid family intramembrane serine protease [Acidimicrobiales bacterium]|nr:rhomboid family intramembrane serine protease [Acidimicrobiales bacterium]